MVTLAHSVLYPLVIVIMLASLSLLLFLLILRFKYAKAELSSPPPKVRIWYILLPLAFGSVLTCSLLVHHTIVIPLVITAVLAAVTLPIFILFWRLRTRKNLTLLSLVKKNAAYILLGATFASIIISSVLIDVTIVFHIAVISGTVSISLLILLMTLRFTRTEARDSLSPTRSKFRYLLLGVALGSVTSFFTFKSVLEIIANENISSIIEALEDSDKLKIWNSFPQSAGATPWAEEEKVITEKDIIGGVLKVLRGTTFELDYVPGAVATKNAIGFWIYKEGTVIEEFSVISATLFVGPGPHGYRPADIHLLSNLRKAVGSNMGN